MDLQGQLDAAAVKLVHDGAPQRLDLLIPLLHLGLGGLGERVPELPDGGAHEEGDHIHAHGLGRPGSVFHRLDRPGLNGLRLSGQLRGCKAVQAGVIGPRQGVAHALARQMVADGPAAQAVPGQGVLHFLHIGRVGGRPLHVQVGSGEFQSLIAHFLRQGTDFFQGQIAPLNRKQCHRSCHMDLLLSMFTYAQRSMGTQTLPWRLLSRQASTKASPSAPSEMVG